MTSPDDHDLPHSLVPLAIAAGLVRHKIYVLCRLTDEGREAELDMLAAFMAATVPLYEYPSDARAAPRALRKVELEGGSFWNGAKELRFNDSRATKRFLAVKATDLEHVLHLLRDPQRTAQILSGFVRQRARRIRGRSVRLLEAAAALRREARALRSARELESPNLKPA